MAGKNLEDSLLDWIDWEKENDLHAPENIKKSGERNFQSKKDQKDREIRYATGRAWKEINEALEVARAIETDGEIDYSQHFEYTRGNRMYDEDSVTDEQQLMDEFGFELADIALFTLKLRTTTVPSGTSRRYLPDVHNLIKLFDSVNSQKTYTDTLEDLKNDLSPHIESGFYSKAISGPDINEEILEFTENTMKKLQGMAQTLPGKSLQNYVSEKIRYNIEERNIDEMDAKHPEPVEGFKRG